ncbi:MAG: pyridoxal-dependent decarboxylase, exosortase A system-associated [Gammaproteobacteria bacterium]|nr:pyridoxal-dependent decarboxylase, exosortase A system-associated [Pseudomonadales bacterium]
MHKALDSVLKYYEVQNNRIRVGGQFLSDIVTESGSPLYLYDLNIAGMKYRKLRDSLPDEVEIHYAIKANPHPEIVTFFKDLGCGVDVASEGELDVALRAGVAANKIGFAGPGKSPSELEAACAAGIDSLNVESEEELNQANAIAERLGMKLNIALRINPAYELVASGMRMGGGPKVFGIDEEQIPAILQKFDRWPNLNFVGFHVFAGSQNLNHQSIITALEQAFSLIEGLLPDCPSPPAMINLGGGFGIPYFATDEELDIQSVGTALQTLLQQKRSLFPQTRFVLETGRYLIGEAGLYIAKILYRKESRGEVFLVLNGGMNHQLAASGNLGQIIKKPYPIALIDRIEAPETETVNVAGPLCTPIDTFGKKVELPVSKAGDLLVVFCSGAYGYTSSPLKFLGHANPLEKVLPANQ